MISAKVIAHSIDESGQEIATLEVEQPKFINAEVNTHRVFSRNGSSSRAIPFSAVVTQLEERPYFPLDVRANERGMQGFKQVPDEVRAEFHHDLKDILHYTKRKVEKWMNPEGMNIHKQHAIRYLEPFLMQKFLITSTEWENWFNLRVEKMAQPEIYQLALAMRDALEASTPKELKFGEWHLPYVDEYDVFYEGSFPSEAYISVGRCAGVSYRAEHSVTKAKELAERLIEAPHLSPTEHQATPITSIRDGRFNPAHLRRDGNDVIWGGNFRGFGQLRGMID